MSGTVSRGLEGCCKVGRHEILLQYHLQIQLVQLIHTTQRLPPAPSRLQHAIHHGQSAQHRKGQSHCLHVHLLRLMGPFLP